MSPAASQEEVKRAFRRASRECHPDLHPGDASAADRFARLARAYEVVSDPRLRAQLDAELAAARSAPGPGPRSGSTSPRSGSTSPRPSRPRVESFASVSVPLAANLTGVDVAVALPDGPWRVHVARGFAPGASVGFAVPASRGGGRLWLTVDVVLPPGVSLVDGPSGPRVCVAVGVSPDQVLFGDVVQVAGVDGSQLRLRLPPSSSSGLWEFPGAGLLQADASRDVLLVETRVEVVPGSWVESLVYRWLRRLRRRRLRKRERAARGRS